MNSALQLIRLLVVSLLCCGLAAAARAAEEEIRFLFQWTDGQGGVHITDNLQKVPEKYRSRAKKLEQPVAGEGSAGSQVQQSWPAREYDTGQAAIDEERKKAEWQQRMVSARLILQLAEEKNGQLENRRKELQAQWGSSGAALPTQEVLDEMKRLDDDIVISRMEVDQARNVVTNVIPDEARRAGVPPGWLREVE